MSAPYADPVLAAKLAEARLYIKQRGLYPYNLMPMAARIVRRPS